MIIKNKALDKIEIELYKNIDSNYDLICINNFIQLLNNLKNTPPEFDKTFLDNIENLLA